jgi:hypothetical protein
VATSAEIKSEMSALAKARLALLEKKSFEELKAFPKSHTEQLEVLGKTVRLTTYQSSYGQSQLLVVVQAFRETLLGMAAQISVAGFVVSSLGDTVPASGEMLWEYQ